MSKEFGNPSHREADTTNEAKKNSFKGAYGKIFRVGDRFQIMRKIGTKGTSMVEKEDYVIKSFGDKYAAVHKLSEPDNIIPIPLSEVGQVPSNEDIRKLTGI